MDVSLAQLCKLEQPSSCSGVNASVPGGKTAAVRAFLKSTRRPCPDGALEPVTATVGGETYPAKIGKPCESSR